MSTRQVSNGVEWAVAGRPLPGQAISGDSHVVEACPDCVLLAVLDGLGHGEEAAYASRLAALRLKHAEPAQGLQALVKDCHEALRGTRGVAMTIALYQPGPETLQWLGIGNVEGVLWHLPDKPDSQRLCVSLRGGVVGYQLPSLHVAACPVAPGDICCLATDGITSAFVEKRPAFREPELLAEHVLQRFGRETDDALVLAVRFGGGGG